MKPELPDNRVIVPISGMVTGEQSRLLIRDLAPHVWGFKLHPSTIIRLFGREHVNVLQFCYDHKARIFIDLKGFDIPSEIANMVRDFEEVADIDMITIHGLGGTEMIEAALAARKKAHIFPVTILTSMKERQFETVFPGLKRDDEIKWLAQVSCSCHADGTISSAADLGLFDENPVAYGNDYMLRCTPGIRPLDSSVKNDDQDRTVTPAMAAQAGADLIVVGRPITGAEHPIAAARAIQREFWNAKQAA